MTIRILPWKTGAIAVCLLIWSQPVLHAQEEGYPGPLALPDAGANPLDTPDLNSYMQDEEPPLPEKTPSQGVINEENGPPLLQAPGLAVLSPTSAEEAAAQAEVNPLQAFRQTAYPDLFGPSVLAYQPGSVLYPSLTRPSLARSEAVQRAINLNQYYNLRVGPARISFTAGAGLEANDNIQLSQTNRQADLIFNYAAEANARWQITKLNTFTLNLGVSYSDYLEHSQYNSRTMSIAPGSALAFDIYVGDFRFNFHDAFSLRQDPATQATASNVTNLGLFTNDGGITALWDLNKVILSFGYEHVDTLSISTPATASYPNENSDNFPFSATFPVSAGVSTGLEANATLADSSYPAGPAPAVPEPVKPAAQQQLLYFRILPPFAPTPVYRTIQPKTPSVPKTTVPSTTSTEQATSLGGFADLRLTHFITLHISGGYQLVAISTPGAPSQQFNGIYGSVGISHRLNSRVSEALEFGRETTVGLTTATEERTYLTHSTNINLIRNVGLATNLLLEDVTTPSFNLSEHLQRAGAGFSLSYQINRKLNVNAQYQYLYKISSLPGNGYVQNRFLIDFSYKF